MFWRPILTLSAVLMVSTALTACGPGGGGDQTQPPPEVEETPVAPETPATPQN